MIEENNNITEIDSSNVDVNMIKTNKIDILWYISY